MSRERRRGGCLSRFLTALVVVVILAVVVDFVAKYVAQDKLASEVQQHGFPKKPSVAIKGFPFLTQVAARDIHQVTISSTNVREGPLRISKISAVAKGIHLHSDFTSGKVDQVSGSVLITFPALAQTLRSQIGPLGSLVSASGLHLTEASPEEVKASASLLVVSGSATWRITRISGQEIHAHLVASSGFPSVLLDSLRNYTIKIPKLPLNVTISSVRITPGGVVAQISGTDLTFSG